MTAWVALSYTTLGGSGVKSSRVGFLFCCGERTSYLYQHLQSAQNPPESWSKATLTGNSPGSLVNMGRERQNVNLDAKQIYMDYITDSDYGQVKFDFDLKSKSNQTSRAAPSLILTGEML